MKRENFTITCNGRFAATKHKWNAACREVEKIVRATARIEGTIYSLTDSASAKDEQGYGHVSGRRVWTSVGGTKLEFHIAKE